MKLHHSALSPFARKVTILAGFLDLADRITLVPGKGNLMLHDPAFRAIAPSGQIPVLETEEGEALFDSPVICEYLGSLAKVDLIGKGAERWRNLRDQAIGDAFCDAALQLRYEIGLRPAALQWDAWKEAWQNKIVDSLAWYDARPGHFDGRRDVGAISVFCALDFVVNRIPEIAWRSEFRNVAVWFDDFAALPEVMATDPYNTRPEA
jgi:glutathione S-transferase